MRGWARPVALVVLAGFPACGGSSGGANRPAAPTDQAELRGVHLIQYEAGRRTVDLRADRGVVRAGSEDLELAAIRGELLVPPRDGRPPELPVRLRAPRGRADLEAGRVELAGGVEVNTSEYRLEVASLSVDRATGRARSEDPATVVGPGFQARGKGLIIEWATARLELLDQVQATYHGPGEATP